MNNRFKEIRIDSQLNMEKFGERLGITKSSVSRIEKGKHNVTEQMIKAVCREYNVNEEWFRTGIGHKYNMYGDDFTKIAASIDRGDPKARKAIMDYWSLSDEDKEIFWKFFEKFIKN